MIPSSPVTVSSVRTLVVPALFDLLGDRMWWPSKPPNERADADSRETVDA